MVSERAPVTKCTISDNGSKHSVIPGILFSGTTKLLNIYIYIEYVFYSLKYNNSFILYLKLHKSRATSSCVVPSSGPLEN